MTTQVAAPTTPSFIGEIHCLNCGRVLADVVRNPGRGTMQLRPTKHQTDVHVIVAGRRLLRCGHCQGRAFVEPFDVPPVESEAAAYAAPDAVA